MISMTYTAIKESMTGECLVEKHKSIDIVFVSINLCLIMNIAYGRIKNKMSY